VRVIARKTLKDHCQKRIRHKDYASLKSALDSWYAEVAKANWSSSAEAKAHYATASIISSDRVVFNIKGNDYRLVAAIHYRRQIVFILWVGTHQEYDKIDARKVRYAD
jgi:mRNA interferase HigB